MTPKAMEELKKLAGSNLEAALLAAVRLGATRSMEAHTPIKRAAEILEYQSEEIKFAFDGNMTADAKHDHDEFKRVAKGLRALI